MVTTRWAAAITAAIWMGTVLPDGWASQGTPGSGQKLTPEEISEFQSKHTGGSPAAGRPLYEKLCASCHRFGEAIGRDVGPDLTTITSRFKKTDVLESILWPSKVISDQYKSEMFELKDGTVVSGVTVRENAMNVFVRTAENPDKPVAVPKGNITNRGESATSLMPAGLLDGYTQEQIADLLAFVMSPPPAK